MNKVHMRVSGILDDGVWVDDKNVIHIIVKMSDTQIRRLMNDMKMALCKNDDAIIREVK